MEVVEVMEEEVEGLSVSRKLHGFGGIVIQLLRNKYSRSTTASAASRGEGIRIK